MKPGKQEHTNKGISQMFYSATSLKAFYRDFIAAADSRGIKPGDRETWDEFKSKKSILERK
jgi:hypothetical protein